MPPSDTVAKSGSVASLRQFARKRAQTERCEMCSRELAVDHQHLIDPEKRKLVCACDACAILFSAADTKLRRVPRRVRFLPNFRLMDEQWNSLMIPIEMAFFFNSSPHGRVVAFYPSPAGAIESLLAFETWNEVVNENPVLAENWTSVRCSIASRVTVRTAVRQRKSLAHFSAESLVVSPTQSRRYAMPARSTPRFFQVEFFRMNCCWTTCIPF